jgi:hypothetical protein
MFRVAIYHYGSYNPPLYNVNNDLIIDCSDRLTEFLDTNAEYKLAMVEINYFNLPLTVAELTQLRNCDRVIVKSMELEPRIIDILCQFDLPNFTFIINGTLNQPLQYAQVDQEIFWMNSTSYPYQHEWIDYTHDKIMAFKPKPYMFDVMYGFEKPHRTFVKQLLTSTDPAWFYQTPFFGYFNPNKKTQQTQNLNLDRRELWEDEVEVDPQFNYNCRYLNREMCVSQVMPFKIYSKTAYTVVLETWADNQYSFFTEKIVKPILAYRLFIVISGQHYLRNLKQIGFRTFDSIVDESYDSEPDDHIRWTKAIEQAKLLCLKSQQEILSQIAPIVLHNYNLLLNLNFSKVNQHAETFLIQHGCYRT